MDTDYGQAQLQRPAGYDETAGMEEKSKKPLLKKVKETVKKPVRKIKHSVAKRKNGDDRTTDDSLTASPEPEEEEVEYEEDDEEQGVDQGVHGAPAVRDTVEGSRTVDNEGLQGREHPAGGEQGGILGLGNLTGNTHENPTAAGSVNTTSTEENQGSFRPTAGEKGANPSLSESFQRMTVSDKPHHENQEETLPTSQDVNTGSHDQFSSAPMQEDGSKQVKSSSGESPASGEQISRELPTQEHNPTDSSHTQPQSYTNKITTVAAGLASTAYAKAATAGSVLKEKVAGSPTAQQTSAGSEQLSSGQEGTDPSQQGYTQKVYSAIAPVKDRAAALASTAYGKAAGTGAAAKEKVAGTTNATTGEGQAGAKSTIADQSQQGYTQKVYSAIAPVKDRAAALASTAYEKAAGAGAAAKEKVAGTTTGEGQAGAKSTIAEKLKPGDEEKALSEVISEMLQSKKDTAKEKAYQAKNMSAEKAYQAKDLTAEKAYQAKDISAQKAAELRDRAYQGKDVGKEKVMEQTGLAKEKANELKDKTHEAKDVGTEKASSTSTPYVEKIKGAVTSLFGSRASADTQSQVATEQGTTPIHQASTEGTESRLSPDQSALSS